MANVTLTIQTQFDQAEKDFRKLESVSESTRIKIEKFRRSFSGDQIDKFIEKNKLAAIAIGATRGPIAATRSEYRGLEKEMQRLIKAGINPQDKAIRKLAENYDRLGKELDQTTKKTSKLGQVMKAGLVYFSGRAVAQFGGHLLRAGSDAEELRNKFDVVFAGISRSTQDWVDNYSMNVARGAEETKTFLATLQDIRTGFGDSGKGAAQFSQVVAGVTNDLSSFSNVKFEEASAAIQSGLSNQFQALRRLGVGLDVRKINQGEYAKSIKKTWLEMTNLEKQEAILTGILKQSKNAIGQNVKSWKDYDFMLGDAAKTSGSFANQTQLLDGLLEDVSAVIGGKLLPAATSLLNTFNRQLAAFKKWAGEGDNLTNALWVLSTAVMTFVGALIAYKVATLAAAFSSGALIAAIKAIGVAIAANPIGAIAVVITAVVIPALMLLAKNWDLVKFKITDFALAARTKMLEFTLSITQNVLGALKKLFNALGDIPKIGDHFKKLAAKQQLISDKTKLHIRITNAARVHNRKRFEESQKQHAKNIANTKASVLAAEDANTKKSDSDKKRLTEFKERLGKMFAFQGEFLLMQSQAAAEFFEKRAEMEGTDHARRIEFLQAQSAKIREIEGLDRDERLAAEKGLRIAIENENKKMLQARLSFGKMALSNVGSMLTDLQATFANAGIKSRGLAIAMKVIAAAQAGINSALAFTSALATVPYPYNFVAAGTVAAAGLAAQARIISTPIPSAQTGLTDYTVPETRSNRNDGAAVMASAGETVDITPRGETQQRNLDMNVYIGEESILRIMQKFVDTGKLNISTNNVGRGVFA